MLTKTEAEDLADLLENLGTTFTIHYVVSGSKDRQFQVIGCVSVRRGEPPGREQAGAGFNQARFVLPG